MAGSGAKHAQALSMLAQNCNLAEIASVTSLSLEQIGIITITEPQTQAQNLD